MKTRPIRPLSHPDMKKVLSMVGMWYINAGLHSARRAAFGPTHMHGHIFIYPAEAELIIAAATLRGDWHAG